MTDLQSKHVALLQNKQIVVTYVLCKLIDFQAHRDALIQTIFTFSWCSRTLFCSKNFCVLHVQSNTTIFHLVLQQKYNYMFRPYMWAIFRSSRVQILEGLKMTQKEPKYVALKTAFYVKKFLFSLNEGITMCLEINQFTQNVRQQNLFILE